jgi:hypothetical protein
VSTSWWLKSQAKSGTCQWNYPNDLELLEGESIEMPINLRKNQEKLERRWFSVIRYNNGVIVEDWFDQTVLNSGKLPTVRKGSRQFFKDQDPNKISQSGYNTFKIDGLQAGTYKITFLSG